MSIDPSVPVGTALQLGSYSVASDIYMAEPAGPGRDRMKCALDALAEELSQTAGEFFVTGSAPELSSLFDGTSIDDRRAFLIELVVADPFAPYWFDLSSRERGTTRTQALKRLAAKSLELDLDSVDQIAALWSKVTKAEAGTPWGAWAKIGAGGLAVAGLALAAGPLIAPLMPAAAGLTGAAATSAGLAQLGFGSIAAGGLGMTGGLWVLGIAGSALGASGTAATQAVTKRAVAVPGQAHLVALELRKLVVSAYLATQSGWFTDSFDEFDQAIDALIDTVEGELATARERNDPKAARVQELERLKKTADFAGEQMRKLHELRRD